jgi:ribosomal protein S27AE
MAKRQCLQCGDELVMAFHPSENGPPSVGEENRAKSNAKWRCSTCGQVFTTAELRADQRPNPKVVAQT